MRNVILAVQTVLLFATLLAAMPTQAQGECFVCPRLSVAATAQPASEAAGTGTFTFTRSAVPPSELVVTFEIQSASSATYGTDYTMSSVPTGTPLRGTVTFPAGQTSATVTVTPAFDLESDAAETVIVNVVDQPHYDLENTNSATVTITPYAHSTVTASVDGTPFNENNDPAILRITRNGDLTGVLTVRVRMGGNAVQGTSGDYTANPALGTTADTTLTIAAGQTMANVTLTPVLDSIPEDLVTVSLTVLDAPAGTPNPTTHYLVGTPAAATVTLVDDDRPTVTLTVTDGVATESGATTGTITLTRNGPTTNAMSIIATLSGTAFLDDYTYTGLNGNQVQIPAGQTSAAFVVRAVNDTAAEVTETVVLTIDTTSDAYNVPGAAFGSILIEDDDNRIVSVTVTDGTATEAGPTTGVVTVTRSGPGTNLPLQVRYTLSGTANSTGTQRDYAVAPANANLVPIQGRLNFTANELSKAITITPVDDSRQEVKETIIVTLVLNGTAYTLGATSAGTVELIDNDTPATDVDNDGVLDAADNCLNVPNGSSTTGPDGAQNNTDADAFGNACDPDDDNDGLNDTAEATRGTKPRVRDTDGDGRSDGEEVTGGTNPLDRFSPDYRPTDVKVRATGTAVEVTWKAPSGSLVNRYLVFRASDPTLLGAVVGSGSKTSYVYNDTTYPGGPHEYFVQAMLPAEAHSLYNATLARGGDAAKIDLPACQAITTDTDDDGLCDAREANELFTDPMLADTDGDGRDDGREAEDGTDPLDSSSVAATEVALSKEAPFWIGLLLLVACAVFLAIGIAHRRRGAPAPEPAAP